MAVTDPLLSLLPQIEANGLMHLSGFFPLVPTPVTFDLLFALVNGQWRLFGISVFVGLIKNEAAPEPPLQHPVAHLPATTPVAQKEFAANGAK